ncbi:MAG: magnesium transporter [Gammaproteobacteria bacterium]|jgi:magnesium transporter
MTANAMHAVNALNQAYLRLHPAESLHAVNKLSVKDVTKFLQLQPASDMVNLWDKLTLETATAVLQQLPENFARQIMQRGEPVQTARVLARLNAEDRQRFMTYVGSTRQRELSSLVEYPEDSAGSLMDPRFIPLYEILSVRESLHRIRKLKPRFTRQIYLIDEEGRLQSMVEIHRLAMAEASTKLAELCQPVPAVVMATATREEVVAQLEQHRITDLPVVDLAGRLIGIIRYDALMAAVREESSLDILTMVGASRDERALSNISFVVRKRLPWLSINLLTAFLAASVVGLFEGTIAKYTALAVLLPVVAGQSGNTGAQALAVTMRGLALREIGTSQWMRVARKEIGAAFVNGVAIALMTGIGVLVWSSSMGLMLVIGSSMVIAMLAAGFAGVVIPMILSSLGQDPAQSSSIILTTVTDVVGFFAFLGIATMLSSML